MYSSENISVDQSKCEVVSMVVHGGCPSPHEDVSAKIFYVQVSEVSKCFEEISQNESVYLI